MPESGENFEPLDLQGAKRAPVSHEAPPSEELIFTPEEVEMMGRAIFASEEGYVNDAVKFWTDQDKLEGWQRVALAPANALEGLIRFGVDTLTGETFEQLKNTINMIADPKQRAVFAKILSKGWGNCSALEKTAFVTELICSFLWMQGGIAKLKKFIPPKKLGVILEKASASRTRIALSQLARGLAKAGEIAVASPADDVVMVGASVAEKAKTKKKGNKKTDPLIAASGPEGQR